MYLYLDNHKEHSISLSNTLKYIVFHRFYSL
nr:MAG TPA: hypothetical protein [Crassvirales sp.]